MAHFDGRNAILLNGRRHLISTKLDIAKHYRVQSCCIKFIDRLNTLDTLLGNIDLGNPWDLMLATKAKFVEGLLLTP